MKKLLGVFIFLFLFSGFISAAYCPTSELDYSYIQSSKLSDQIDARLEVDPGDSYASVAMWKDTLNQLEWQMDDLAKEHARLWDAYESCILDSIATSKSKEASPQQKCESTYWNNVYHDPSTDLCYCDAWYSWSSDGTLCEKKSPPIIVSGNELENAINWMYNNGLTSFNTPVSFMHEKWLRRDEATKFFVKYAKEVMGIEPDVSRSWCNFTDLDQARSDLRDLIKESCQLGLFQGHQGKFMPTQELTNAQAIAVFIRLIDWYKDESWSHWANEYYTTAGTMWLLDGLSLSNKSYSDVFTTRGEVSRMLFRGKDK